MNCGVCCSHVTEVTVKCRAFPLPTSSSRVPSAWPRAAAGLLPVARDESPLPGFWPLQAAVSPASSAQQSGRVGVHPGGVATCSIAERRPLCGRAPFVHPLMGFEF